MGNLECPQSPVIEGDLENGWKDPLGPPRSLLLGGGAAPWLAYLSHIHSISTEEGSSSSLNFTLWHAAASN